VLIVYLINALNDLCVCCFVRESSEVIPSSKHGIQEYLHKTNYHRYQLYYQSNTIVTKQNKTYFKGELHPVVLKNSC